MKSTQWLAMRLGSPCAAEIAKMRRRIVWSRQSDTHDVLWAEAARKSTIALGTASAVIMAN